MKPLKVKCESSMPALADVAREKLSELEALGRRRRLLETHREEGMVVMRGARRLISFSFNDYMGLLHHADVKAAAMAAIEKYGTGAGASRLVTGNHPLYTALEQSLAEWKGAEAALVFGSGYLANLGIIPALMGKADLVLTDRLAHACIIDGAQLSGAKFMRFKHNDVQDCARLLASFRKEHRHCLIATDEVFSMDGDLAPLQELSALAKEHDAWLMADGAHSFAGAHPPVDIYVGTLSKALGSYGGYLCASEPVIELLKARARSFVYTTGLPPASAAAALAALDIIEEEPARCARPLLLAHRFAEAVGLPPPASPIVPVIVGAPERALGLSKALERAGFLVVAIRPPTVPDGTARLRFTFSAAHDEAQVDALAEAFITALSRAA
jgi:8-amino-7-oxononanoate synthase